MASWNAFSPRESQEGTSGRVSASPRSRCGSTLPWAVHFSRPRSLGKVPVTSPGTATTSHSRPLDLCAVSTLTVFSPPGSALSRPFSYWAAVRRKPRKASRVASLSPAAKDAAMSRKLARVSRRRAARACGDADSSTSRPVTARTRWSTSMRGSASERRRSRSSAARRAKRTRASGEKGSPSSSPPPSSGDSRNVSRASASEITSAGSTPSTASASRRSGSSSPSTRAWDTRRRARRPSRARSRGPMRQRGPVSSRTREAFAPGSWSTSQTATRSAISGRCSRPDRPTTSTGTSRATRAAWISAKSVAVRHRTAISPGALPVFTRCAIESAIQSISSAWVDSRAQRTVPSRSAPGAGRSASTPACMARSGSARPLARSSSRPPLRRFSLSDWRVAGRPSACGKCSGKSSRLATEAPRQP